MTLPPFQELVDAHWRDVARLCMALAGPEEGQDAAQRAWLQALQAYATLRHGSNLRGWLLTIAAHAATDEHRARRRRPIPIRRLPDAANGDDPISSYDAKLWDHVRKLPVRQRTAVALHYVIGLPHAHVARVIGTTPQASRRLVSDALQTLRRSIRDEVMTS
jgi:RNA polymerase sigma factor (sigma-70 family)